VSKYFLEITIRGPCKHFWGQIWAATALSGTKTVTVKLTKKAAVNLTALPLHIYWVPHWPRVILKMDSGVLFHTLFVIITNFQRQKKRMLIVIHFNPSRSFLYADLWLAA